MIHGTLVMIHPQVHLRIPCYDFYFLYPGKFADLLGKHTERAGLAARPQRVPSDRLINKSDR